MYASATGFLRGTALALGLTLFPFAVPAQDRIDGSTLDGATFSLPSVWVEGETLTISGADWTTNGGNLGSVIGVKYDHGAVVPADPLDEIDDLWARISATRDGDFTFDLPYPDDAGWEVGEQHTIHLLTGSLGMDDKVRNPTLRLTIVQSD